ncbi:MAG: serine/threonine protein kinase [Ignavibacteriae bacterium]|nr:PEGA domain-containing protein [Ignavibacteriota bacterium]NOG96816.1 serine/threonine protein kinase [Ignavibacteriota bacterium]
MKSLIGQTIDNYHILEILGQGGMGVVYKAEDKALEKEVAIKVIDPFLARDEGFLRRFKTEAKAMAKLTNPNIVTVHALRETEFGFFMVMEFVDSKTLSEWVKEGEAFSLDETLAIAKQLLGAVGYAHNAGVIHRDIKPSNILVSKAGKVKIMDFGLAKVMKKHSPESTVTHMRAGTLYYMSPEQVKGLKNVDVRSDIYSVGMTIYEMLAGRRPFEKTDTEFTIQKQIVDGKIPSPVKFNSNIPKPLAKIILKSISQDPSKRYQKAEEMLAAIQEYEQGKKPKTKTDDSVGTASTGNNKKLIYGAAGLSIFILIILLFSFGVFSSDGTVEPGYLNIKTNPPNAAISVNQKAIGQSPVVELELQAGKTQIEIQKEGYLSFDTSIVVENDEEYSLIFNLEKEAEEIIAEIPDDNKAIEFGRIKINSSPNGSTVYLNGKRVGETPFEDNNLKTGRYNIIIRNADHIDYKRTVNITNDKLTPISATLLPAGKVSLKSKPSGSIVYLNGNRIGTTPISNKSLRESRYQLKFTKEGYKDLDTTINVIHKERTNLTAALNLSTGLFKILVRPYGSVYINNKKISENSIAQITEELTVGKYGIRAVHPTLGSWEKQIEITDGKTNEFVVDFNREYEVIVTSTPINAQIKIDGKLSGKYTPKLIKLRMGNHSIGVEKEGFALMGSEKKIIIEKDIKETPIHFDLKKN